jgi:hypothetical protein
MNPLFAAFVKAGDVILLYPFHRILHHQQVHNKKFKRTFRAITRNKNYKNLYKGIGFQLAQSSINRYADTSIYNAYGTGTEAICLSSLFKCFTYPLHTCEIYYQLNNKYLYKPHQLYKGYIPFMLTNAFAYYIWWTSLNYYNSHYKCKNSKQQKCINGFLSGITVDICVHPLRVIKTNLQNQTKLINLFKTGGIAYRGFVTKIFLSGIQSAIFNVFVQ